MTATKMNGDRPLTRRCDDPNQSQGKRRWPKSMVLGVSLLGLSACRPTFPVPVELEDESTHYVVVAHARPFSPAYHYSVGPYRFDILRHSEEREEESQDSVRTIKTERRSFELSRGGEMLTSGRCVDTFAWTKYTRTGIGTLRTAHDVVDSLECEASDQSWTLEVSKNEATDAVNDYAGTFVRGSEQIPVRSLHGQFGDMAGSLEGYAMGPQSDALAAAQNVSVSYDGAVWLSESADPEVLAALLATLTFSPHQ